MLLLLLACTAKPDDSAPPSTQPWTSSQPRLEETLRGARWQRGIMHLHSTWSHDACDGDPLPDGHTNEPCLADLRAALCTTGMDFAYLTDHPTHAAFQGYDDLLLMREDDQGVEVGGRIVANAMACADGGAVLLRPGFEDVLMPLGIEQHVPGDGDQRDATLNSSTPEATAAMQEAGALVFVAHTEGRDRDDLLRWQTQGVRGVEAFNLHAMVAPDIRQEDLGLDPWAWATDIEPFTHPQSLAEPDLLFLAFFQAQPPSLAHWDALSAVREGAPAVGIGGTDAHQNVLPLELRDGERVDSYRRMIRWFSNWVMVQGDGPQALDASLDAGRVAVVFEVLGTPTGLDVHLEADGDLYEIGSDAPPGTLVVACPTLHPRSPHGEEPFELQALVLKDGQPFAEGCGEHALSEPGVYRVELHLTPWHLRPFLGEDPEPWLHPYPWVLFNPIRVISAR